MAAREGGVGKQGSREAGKQGSKVPGWTAAGEGWAAS